MITERQKYDLNELRGYLSVVDPKRQKAPGSYSFVTSDSESFIDRSFRLKTTESREFSGGHELVFISRNVPSQIQLDRSVISLSQKPGSTNLSRFMISPRKVFPAYFLFVDTDVLSRHARFLVGNSDVISRTPYALVIKFLNIMDEVARADNDAYFRKSLSDALRTLLQDSLENREKVDSSILLVVLFADYLGEEGKIKEALGVLKTLILVFTDGLTKNIRPMVLYQIASHSKKLHRILEADSYLIAAIRDAADVGDVETLALAVKGLAVDYPEVFKESIGRQLMRRLKSTLGAE